MIDYGDFMALAAVETPRRVMLSADSITLFQSGFQWFRNRREWEDDTDPLSDLEEDVRDALVAQAFDELLGNNVDLGTIFPFATAAAPANSLECDGTHYLRVDYPELYAALASAFIVDADHFKVPDLRGHVILGVGTTPETATVYAMNATGGQEQHALTNLELPEHNHAILDPGHSHTLTDPGHSHTLTDPGHTHTLNNPTHSHTLTDPGHSHTLTDPGHIHTVTDPGHVHTGARAATNQQVADGTVKTVPTSAATNTGSNTTGVTVNSHTTGITEASNTTGITSAAAAAGQTAQSATTGITQASHTTGITEASALTGIATDMAGTSARHENRQIYTALRFALWAK